MSDVKFNARPSKYDREFILGPGYLNHAEAARYAGCPRDAIKRWIERGYLQVEALNGYPYIVKSSLDVFLARGEVKPPDVVSE